MTVQKNPSQILLVEDSEEDKITVTRAFLKSGFVNELLWLRSGDEAIDYLFGDNPLPGMILLDLNMPGVGGLEVLKVVKNHEKLKKIPVIVLTTSGDERDIEVSYLSGANSYIEKPLDFAEFVRALSQLKNYWFEISVLPR